MNLKRKVILNQNKLKRLTEELNMNNKEADLKVSLISSERLMLKTLSNTETTNSKNLTNSLTLSLSWEETLTGKKLINLLNWTKHLLKNLLSLWLKALKTSPKFWEDLPVILNLKNLLKLWLLKIKLFNQLNKKLNNQFNQNQFKKLRSRNHNKPNQSLSQNQKLSNQLNKFQLLNKLKKLQLLLNKLQLNKKLNKPKKVNKNQSRVKDNLEVTTETEDQDKTEVQESTEDQEKTEVQENTEDQEVKVKKVKEEPTTIKTDKDQTTDQRIKNKNKMTLIQIHHSKENKLPETSEKKKSDNSLMKDSKLLESQNQKPKKDKKNIMKELTEERLITIINKIDWMYI